MPKTLVEHPEAAKPSTSEERAPLHWVIVLQKDDKEVRIQPDWRTAIQVGDYVKFVSTEGFAQVNFEETKGADEHSLCPFGENLKVIEDDDFHEVLHSCKGAMQCSIHLDGKTYGYKEPPHENKVHSGDKPKKEPAGSNLCWKGGQNPVNC
jgi:hypothetical protein